MGLCKFKRFCVGCRNLAPSAKIRLSKDMPRSGDIHHVRFITASKAHHRLRMHRGLCTQGEKIGSEVLLKPWNIKEIRRSLNRFSAF
jgi:hypothetical protein